MPLPAERESTVGLAVGNVGLLLSNFREEQPMTNGLRHLAISCCVCFLAVHSQATGDDRIGGIQLLPGYKHEKLQGIDSIVGRIAKPGGLTIHYEIGAIPQGGLRFGGSFVDRPKKVPQDQLRWYREQMVQGQPVHIAYLKNNSLLVSYPQTIPGKGINFHTQVKSTEELADALLMLLTFPDKAAK